MSEINMPSDVYAVVEKIETAGQLDDATGRQTELGGWGRCCGTKNMEEYANDL